MNANKKDWNTFSTIKKFELNAVSPNATQLQASSEVADTQQVDSLMCMQYVVVWTARK